MAAPTLDLKGRRFGRLTAVTATDARSGSSVVWHCECDCGGFAKVASASLVKGLTRSCGCLFRATRRVAWGKRSPRYRGAALMSIDNDE